MTLLEIRGPHVFDELKVFQIIEWEGEAMPHGVLFPGIPADAIRKASPSGENSRLTETGMIVSSTQMFLVTQGNRAILIEAGSGNGKARPDEPYWDHQNLPYRETLAAAGVGLGDVEYVFLSHMHPDHVGLATTWNGDRWEPTFPGAKYVLAPREWAYWNGFPAGDPARHPCINDSILPLVEAGSVQFARGGERIGPVRVHDTTGHTPGHLVFELEDRNVWFLGDLIHHPAQAPHPEWSAADWDFDRELARSQRRRFFHQFAESRATLLAAHTGDPFRVEEISPGRFMACYGDPMPVELCPSRARTFQQE
ncbi:MAG: MBL fold metallo-hydrolase [Anaerolineales bacterium]|nr:MBL fold metallo-hydrolase [Anaerolineales bacterium]